MSTFGTEDLQLSTACTEDLLLSTTGTEDLQLSTACTEDLLLSTAGTEDLHLSTAGPEDIESVNSHILLHPKTRVFILCVCVYSRLQVFPIISTFILFNKGQ